MSVVASAIRGIPRRFIRNNNVTVRSCSTTLPTQFPKYDPTNLPSVFENMSTTDIITNGLLYTILANKTVVDVGVSVSKSLIFGRYSPTPIKFCTKHFLMWTILSNFYSGDYGTDCIDSIERLHKRDRITGIMDNSFPEDETNEDRFREYMEENMAEYGRLYKEEDNGGVRFAAVKPTALLHLGMLERLTEIIERAEDSALESDSIIDYDNQLEMSLNSLDKADRTKFNHGVARLEKSVRCAMVNKIAILLDAEKSHLQPAVELVARIVSKKYNKKHFSPGLYCTYQMYMRRTPYALERDMAIAKKNQYVFAAKIVRGAYMMSEREAALDLGDDDPVLATREDTSSAYNTAISDILEAISTLSMENNDLINGNTNEIEYEVDGSAILSNVGVCIPSVMIATHNRISLQLAVDSMSRLSIPNNSVHVNFAQILGMCDNLTITLARSGNIPLFIE